jgi:hypothetical protein
MKTSSSTCKPNKRNLWIFYLYGHYTLSRLGGFGHNLKVIRTGGNKKNFIWHIRNLTEKIIYHTTEIKIYEENTENKTPFRKVNISQIQTLPLSYVCLVWQLNNNFFKQLRTLVNWGMLDHVTTWCSNSVSTVVRVYFILWWQCFPSTVFCLSNTGTWMIGKMIINGGLRGFDLPGVRWTQLLYRHK